MDLISIKCDYCGKVHPANDGIGPYDKCLVRLTLSESRPKQFCDVDCMIFWLRKHDHISKAAMSVANQF